MCHLLHKVWYNLYQGIHAERYFVLVPVFNHRDNAFALEYMVDTVRFTLFVVLKTISIYTSKSYKNSLHSVYVSYKQPQIYCQSSKLVQLK